VHYFILGKKVKIGWSDWSSSQRRLDFYRQSFCSDGPAKGVGAPTSAHDHPSTHSEDKRIARTSESGVDPAIEEVELKIERQSSEPERIHGSPAISDVASDDIKAISRRTSDNRNWIFPACVIVAVVILLAFFLTHNNDAPQLEFESGNSGYFAIKNVDTHPIKLLDVSINEREECKPRVGLFGLKPFESTELKVGDVILLLSPCSIVRTTLTTETGDWTHSFSR
jgi:hypothetical protein